MLVPLYDDFADYDRFVNWSRRLAHEMPFLELQLERVGARRVLDAACGTGQHTIALAQRGYDVVGADLSQGMIERARENAAAAGVEVDFVVAGLGAGRAAVEGAFDAVLCLGNSLPHVLTAEGLQATMADFAALLRPGGLLLIQNRNFDRILARDERWMPVQSHREGEREWVFVRWYDFNADRTITFSVLTLTRQELQASWTQQVAETALYPWQLQELLPALAAAGLNSVTCYGDMSGAAWDPSSGNLILAAWRPEGAGSEQKSKR